MIASLRYNTNIFLVRVWSGEEGESLSERATYFILLPRMGNLKDPVGSVCKITFLKPEEPTMKVWY